MSLGTNALIDQLFAFGPDEVRPEKLIDALPAEAQAHFTNTTNEILMGDDGVGHVMEIVRVLWGRTAEDDFKELLDAVWNGNVRRPKEELASCLMRRLNDFELCRSQLRFEVPIPFRIQMLEEGARLKPEQIQH